MVYVVIKGVVFMFIKLVVIELVFFKIIVNVVDFGLINIGWMSSELKEELLLKFLMGWFGEFWDVVKLVIFLVSEELEWIIG